MTLPPDALAAQALAMLLALPAGTRKLIAVAGPPGSGKSTIAAEICLALNAQGRKSALVPMDGYHLDNRLLDPAGLRSRKGAPETFDAAGFVHLMRRIADGEDVVFPVFDRERDIAIAGADRLAQGTEFVVVEGNYLLLDRDPWRALSGLWCHSIWIDVPRPVLITRLMARWRSAGLAEVTARQRCMENDMPNADLVSTHSLPADQTIRSA